MSLKFLIFAGAALTLTFNAASAQNKIIAIDGSSTVFPITEAMAEEFQKANTGVKVTVGIAGTGGGFKKFCRGETDISDASRPITEKERADCKKPLTSNISSCRLRSTPSRSSSTPRMTGRRK